MSQQIVSSYESILVPVPNGDQIHVAYLPSEKNIATVLLLPGMANNSSIFREKDAGIAHFLQQAGFSVFLADLRGKGSSWPPINRYATQGLNQVINEDLPAILRLIEKKMSTSPNFYLGQGAAGLLLTGFLSRKPEYIDRTDGLIYFGCRRMAHCNHWSRGLLWRWYWKYMVDWAVSMFGYLPGKILKIGNDNETLSTYQEYLDWCNDTDWVDGRDKFSYSDALMEKSHWPASLYFASHADHSAQPRDVSDFMRSLGPHDGRQVTLGKRQGNLREYSHLGMLRHPDSLRDHLPLMLEWMTQQLDRRSQRVMASRQQGPIPA